MVRVSKQLPEPDKAGAAIGESDVLKDVKPVTRDSEAAQGESSFEQYHEIVDRYFKAITK